MNLTTELKTVASLRGKGLRRDEWRDLDRVTLQEGDEVADPLESNSMRNIWAYKNNLPFHFDSMPKILLRVAPIQELRVEESIQWASFQNNWELNESKFDSMLL